jgi:gamma-glutamyltranspeptidase/glutathione hydrolase
MTDGIVVCPQPIAAEAALEVLQDGGNAVDAIVAAALVQGVVDPLMCGLGGYGIMQVHDAATGDDHVVDFFSRAPGGIVEGQGPKLQREFEYDYGFILEGEDN